MVEGRDISWRRCPCCVAALGQRWPTWVVNPRGQSWMTLEKGKDSCRVWAVLSQTVDSLDWLWNLCITNIQGDFFVLFCCCHFISAWDHLTTFYFTFLFPTFPSESLLSGLGSTPKISEKACLLLSSLSSRWRYEPVLQHLYPGHE